MDQTDDIHVAVALSHLDEARCLLSQDYTLVNHVDINGNQPMHVAAKEGNLDLMKLLIQYDAPIGRRNYEGLTPVGIARFHNEKEVVKLLNNYYERIKNYIGDEPEKFKYKRINRHTIQSQTDVRVLEKEERIKQASLLWVNIKKHQYARLIQYKIRQYLAAKHSKQMKIEHVNAVVIQNAWNHYQDRKGVLAATKIQSFQRMVVMKSYFINYLKDRLTWYRSSRILATTIQKLYHGHKGRSTSRRLIDMQALPNPRRAIAFDAWLQIQHISHPPSRTWNIYSEYVLSGKPRTWKERRIKRNGRYRDVVFYVNNLTRQARWEQPPNWIDLDRRDREHRLQVLKLGYTHCENETATKLQLLWRTRIAKRNLALFIRAQKVMKQSIDKYEEQPDNIVSLCNYTLHLHVVKEDIGKAKIMYQQCLSRMEGKGSDNVFILYSYAIFCASTGREFESYTRRAQVVEQAHQKRHNNKISMYVLANEIFKLAAIEKLTSQSLHNYALCRMIAFQDFDGSKALFVKAMKSATLLDEMDVIKSNFNVLLKEHGQEDDALDVFRKEQSLDNKAF